MLEDLWRQQDRDPFLQGLILFAAAHVHVQRSNAAGCRKVMTKAVIRLCAFTPHRWGVDVAGIISHADRALAILNRMPAEASLPQYIAYPQLPPIAPAPAPAPGTGTAPGTV